MKLITNKIAPTFWLLSDTHLIANELHDNGSSFQRMRNTSAGKDLDYQEIALTAFVRKALKFKPDVLIITGDVTFNGEKASAERLSEIFAPLTKAGIAFLILSGNHDIYDGWAREFIDCDEYRTAQISPLDWENIFSSSYEYAVSRDPDSLAYSVNLNQDYRLILADSNIYGNQASLTHPITNGRISTTELVWIENELISAQKQGQHVLFFMHHNICRHNKMIYQGYILDNAVQLQSLLAKYRVRLVFSGHMHAQNIIGPFSNCDIAEVASSCFCMTNQGYGVVKLNKQGLTYQEHSFTMEKYLTNTEKQQLGMLDFHDYLQNIFFSVGEKQMRHFLTSLPEKEDVEGIVKFADKMNWNYFIGKSDYSNKEKEQIINSQEYQLIAQYLPSFKEYIDSFLLVDQNSQYLSLTW